MERSDDDSDYNTNYIETEDRVKLFIKDEV